MSLFGKSWWARRAWDLWNADPHREAPLKPADLEAELPPGWGWRSEMAVRLAPWWFDESKAAWRSREHIRKGRHPSGFELHETGRSRAHDRAMCRKCVHAFRYLTTTEVDRLHRIGRSWDPKAGNPILKCGLLERKRGGGEKHITTPDTWRLRSSWGACVHFEPRPPAKRP